MAPIANRRELKPSIYVDSLTAVPFKLYMEFENAGVSAKNRGQHTLRESRATDGTLIRRLVLNQDDGESQRGQRRPMMNKDNGESQCGQGTSRLDIFRAKLAALHPVCPARWSVGAGRPVRSGVKM